jgi:signal transduction histidine kinase
MAQLNSEPTEEQRRGGLVLSTLTILLIPIVVSAITFAVLIASRIPPGQFPAPIISPIIPVVVLAIFASALIVLVRLGRPTLGALALIGTWTIFTTITMLRSGVSNYSAALLILPICAAGLLFDRLASISLASLAIILVGSVAWLESAGLVIDQPPPLIVQQLVADNRQAIAFAFWSGIFIAVAALTSLLAGDLQTALRRTRAQAAELQAFSNELEARVAAQSGALVAQERQAAMLEERTRLAREIHDTIAQGLAGVSVQLGAAQRALQVAPEAAGEHLQLAQQLARESLAEARRSVWNLRAGALERGNLVDALRSLCEQQSRTGSEHAFVEEGLAWDLPLAYEDVLLRVAQEGIANASKHAFANNVTISLGFRPEAVQLTIHDNGVGFDSAILQHAVVPQPQGGFGLLGMRERLESLGGTLALQNEQGALVVATLPRR